MSQSKRAMDKQARRWGPRREVVAILGLGPKAIDRLVRRGFIGTLRLPDSRLKYDLGDARRLAAEAIRPATVGTPQTRPIPDSPRETPLDVRFIRGYRLDRYKTTEGPDARKNV